MNIMCEIIMNFFKGIKMAIQGNHVKLDDPDWRDGNGYSR